jgi:hypothetical protein
MPLSTPLRYAAGTARMGSRRNQCPAMGRPSGGHDDPVGDFLPSFVGPHNGDMDAVSVSATFDGSASEPIIQQLELFGFAGGLPNGSHRSGVWMPARGLPAGPTCHYCRPRRHSHPHRLNCCRYIHQMPSDRLAFRPSLRHRQYIRSARAPCQSLSVQPRPPCTSISPRRENTPRPRRWFARCRAARRFPNADMALRNPTVGGR